MSERTSWLSRPVAHRNRFALVGDPASRAETERRGLREAICDLLGPESIGRDAIAAGVREHWGPATDQQIGRALTVLLRGGAIRRVRDGYARRES